MNRRQFLRTGAVAAVAPLALAVSRRESPCDRGAHSFDANWVCRGCGKTKYEILYPGPYTFAGWERAMQLNPPSEQLRLAYQAVWQDMMRNRRQ